MEGWQIEDFWVVPGYIPSKSTASGGGLEIAVQIDRNCCAKDSHLPGVNKKALTIFCNFQKPSCCIFFDLWKCNSVFKGQRCLLSFVPPVQNHWGDEAREKGADEPQVA